MHGTTMKTLEGTSCLSDQGQAVLEKWTALTWKLSHRDPLKCR